MVRRLFCWVFAWAVVAAAVPAWADFNLERRLTLAPGGTFELDTDTGAVTVTGDATSGAAVSIASPRDDFERRYDIQFEERAGIAVVRVKRRGSWLDELWGGGWRGQNVRFTVRVPRATTLNVRTSGGAVRVSSIDGNARLRTSGGTLRVDDVSGMVDLNTSGGSIAVQRVRGDVTADTSGGAIEIESVTGAVTASTSGGSVDIRGAGGRVDARTSGGSVSVAFSRGNGQGGTLSTSGGGVSAEIDPGVALSIDASTSGGDVSSDLPVSVRGTLSRNALRGDLNGGGPTLRLRSSGGGIRLAAVRGSAAGR